MISIFTYWIFFLFSQLSAHLFQFSWFSATKFCIAIYLSETLSPYRPRTNQIQNSESKLVQGSEMCSELEFWRLLIFMNAFIPHARNVTRYYKFTPPPKHHHRRNQSIPHLLIQWPHLFSIQHVTFHKWPTCMLIYPK